MNQSLSTKPGQVHGRPSSFLRMAGLFFHSASGSPRRPGIRQAPLRPSRAPRAMPERTVRVASMASRPAAIAACTSAPSAFGMPASPALQAAQNVAWFRVSGARRATKRSRAPGSPVSVERSYCAADLAWRFLMARAASAETAPAAPASGSAGRQPATTRHSRHPRARRHRGPADRPNSADLWHAETARGGRRSGSGGCGLPARVAGVGATTPRLRGAAARRCRARRSRMRRLSACRRADQDGGATAHEAQQRPPQRRDSRAGTLAPCRLGRGRRAGRAQAPRRARSRPQSSGRLAGRSAGGVLDPVEQIAPPIADRAAQRDISGAGAGGPTAFGVIPCATGS